MTSDMKVLRMKDQRVEIPRYFYRLHKMVTIAADVMFVSEIPSQATFLRMIKFRMAEFIPKWTARLLSKSLKKVLMLYA